MSGWFKLHRKIFENPMWTERRKYSKFEAWIDLLQLVSYTDNNKQYINGSLCEWGRGQYPISISFLSERWDWSSKQVRTYLERARQNKQIELKSANKWTMLTICKYDNYQAQGQSGGQTKGKQRATIKEYKEIKEQYVSIFNDWLQYRFDINKPINNVKTLKQLVKKFESNSVATCEMVVNTSIENQWQGLFWDDAVKKTGLKDIAPIVARMLLKDPKMLQEKLDEGYTKEQIENYAK